jgi:CheY-like chemotaxis protein
MPSSHKTLESAHILLIDDDLLNLSLLTEILHMHSFSNLTDFNNPVNAVEFYRANRPDLVLLDFRMPQLNGLDVLKIFYADMPHPPPPVIVLTADNNERTHLSLRHNGANAILIKPYNIDELISKVKSLLNIEFECQNTYLA